MNNFELMDEWIEKTNPLHAEGKNVEANAITEKYFSNLLEPKYSKKFGFMLVASLIKGNFKISNYEDSLKWCMELLKFDLKAMDRYDDGEREFYTGATYYEMGDFVNAKKYLEMASKKSKGRSLKLFNDMKYAKFLKS